MNEKQALEELRFIKQIIDDSKKELAYNGIDYIIWGTLTFIGLISTYLSIGFSLAKYSGIIWIVIVSIGYVFSYFNKKKERKEISITFLKKSISAIWFATGISMLLFGFLAPISGVVKSNFICPSLSIVLGTAYFITGSLVESKWMKYVTIGWWSGASLMLFIPGQYSLLVMAFMMMAFQTIPGVFIYIRFKKEMKAAN